jgi:hypothetical protein
VREVGTGRAGRAGLLEEEGVQRRPVAVYGEVEPYEGGEAGGGGGSDRDGI